MRGGPSDPDWADRGKDLPPNTRTTRTPKGRTFTLYRHRSVHAAHGEVARHQPDRRPRHWILQRRPPVIGGRPRNVRGRPWTIRECSQVVRERPQNIRERSQVVCETSWVICEASWTIRETSWTIRETSWVIRETSWIIRETSWIIRGTSWNVCEASWNTREASWITCERQPICRSQPQNHPITHQGEASYATFRCSPLFSVEWDELGTVFWMALEEPRKLAGGKPPAPPPEGRPLRNPPRRGGGRPANVPFQRPFRTQTSRGPAPGAATAGRSCPRLFSAVPPGLSQGHSPMP